MRVLLADEDRELSEFVRGGLGEEGFIVDVAYDGDTAFQMAAESDHDAILLEIGIPKLNGFEVLKKLRTQGNNVPVIFITSNDLEQNKLYGLNNGADDYILKPFRLAEMIARLRAILRRSAKNGRRISSGSTLRAGVLELDLLKHKLRRSGKPVHLTKVEFDLLEYLMRRPGDVISHSVLKQHLFKDESNLDTNVLPVHIRNLRSKIDHRSDKSLIRTVRSCGYALDV